jgi:excisionase family DNA binding protein
MLPQHENLTPTQVRKFLQISKSTCYEMLADGIIPSFKVGRQYRISRERFLQWYERQNEGENNSSG